MGNRILTIEDEEAIRASFVSFLEDYGFEMLEAENGEAGIELIEKELPDLLLVDLRMPKVDGLTVMDYIRTNHPSIPVIAVSGTGNIADVIEAMHLGAWDYILKPVEDLNILLYAVKRALEKVRLYRENEKYRERLESEVDKKTSQLTEANIRLKSINYELKEIVKNATRMVSINRIDQFGEEIMGHFGQHLMAAGGSIYLIRGEQLVCVSCLDPGHAPKTIDLPLKPDSPFQKVLETGQSLFCSGSDDISLAPSGWKGYQDDSFLIYPIRGQKGRIIGLLSIHNKTIPPFTEEDYEIGALLAAFCSEGLRATNAFEELLERERELEQSLSEKDVLLREIHHRVKNNMQIIISLMNLQRPVYKEEFDQRLVDKSIRRIQAMALAHEQLYRTEDLTKINLSLYVRGIVEEILRNSTMVGSKIKVSTAIEDHNIALDQIIPVGIIIHELVDNALEHAFRDGRAGWIKIEGGAVQNRCSISVTDNGTGLSADFDLETAGSLGFMLVKTLTSQIDGTVQYVRDGGTCFLLEFACSQL